MTDYYDSMDFDVKREGFNLTEYITDVKRETGVSIKVVDSTDDQITLRASGTPAQMRVFVGRMAESG